MRSISFGDFFSASLGRSGGSNEDSLGTSGIGLLAVTFDLSLLAGMTEVGSGD